MPQILRHESDLILISLELDNKSLMLYDSIQRNESNMQVFKQDIRANLLKFFLEDMECARKEWFCSVVATQTV